MERLRWLDLSIKLVNIKDITIDSELYPRTKPNYQTYYDYSVSMKVGTKFPPIKLAKLDNKLYLIDGLHRIEAKKLNKESTIEAEIIEGLTRKDIILESIKDNISHGTKLSYYDRLSLVPRLRKMNLTDMTISSIIQLPYEKMKTALSNRLVNSITGETILKASVKHLSKEDNYDFSTIEKDQQLLSTKSQISLIDQLLVILDKNMLKKNKHLFFKLKKLRNSIDNYIE